MTIAPRLVILDPMGLDVLPHVAAVRECVLDIQPYLHHVIRVSEAIASKLQSIQSFDRGTQMVLAR